MLPMSAMAARAAAGTYVLIDAENIDWAVSHIVGRKPEQQDRVQFDKLVAFCESKFLNPVRCLVALNVKGEVIPDSMLGFIKALRAAGCEVVPLYGRNDQKVVDIAILKMLAAIQERSAGVVLASHDDRTEAEIAENVADGISISEFPVTMAAALAARASGMDIIAGAPNIVRGGSHSGNVAASDLVRADAVDAFASDYVPASLIEAAFICVADTGIGLPDAIALVTDRPARMANLHDRGRIETGLRADLVRVRVHNGLPVVREVWRAGERVA